MIEKTRNVEIIKIKPRIRKKTLKNKNTFGFKTFIKKPVI